MGTLALDILILCLTANVWQALQSFSYHKILKRMFKWFLICSWNRVYAWVDHMCAISKRFLNNRILYHSDSVQSKRFRDWQKRIKTVSKYITAFDYTDKNLLVLLGAYCGFSLCLFTTVIGTPVGTASVSVSVVFLISNEMMKMLLKAMGKTKKYTQSIFC